MYKETFYGVICAESPNLSFDWKVERDFLEVKWYDYWAFGGQEEGCFEMPIHFLYDEQAFQEYQKQEEIKQQTKEQEEIMLKEQAEKEQLKKLKEKYEKE